MGKSPLSSPQRKRCRTFLKLEKVGAEPVVSRQQSLQAAAVQVNRLAKQSQQDALGLLQDASELLQFVSKMHKMDEKGKGGPLTVMTRLLKELLGERWMAISSGQDLVSTLQAWDSSSMATSARDSLKAFVEEQPDKENDDLAFSPGAHLGGPCENALFEWVDASLTLATS